MSAQLSIKELSKFIKGLTGSMDSFNPYVKSNSVVPVFIGTQANVVRVFGDLDGDLFTLFEFDNVHQYDCDLLNQVKMLEYFKLFMAACQPKPITIECVGLVQKDDTIYAFYLVDGRFDNKWHGLNLSRGQPGLFISGKGIRIRMGRVAAVLFDKSG